MRIGFHIYWFLVGFAVAALVAAAFQPDSAAAQGRPRTAAATGGNAAAAARQQPALRGTQSPAAEETLPDDADMAEEGDAAARVEALADETAEIDQAEASAPGQVGFRATMRDGDHNFPGEPAEQQDGVFDAEPPTPQDGADATRIDMRGPEDVAPFENPPAGYDPLLFQIEDLDPVADRRIGRLYRFEPYDPAGIKAGGFVVFPEVEVVGIAQRNVLRAPLAKSDVAIATKPSVRVVSDWSRHALEFRASGDFSGHDRFASEDDRAYHLEARGRLDVHKRTNVQVEVLRDVTQESRQVLESNRLASRADITLDSVQTSLNQRFNRLSVQLRGGVSETDFGSVESGGAVQSNSDRNYRRANEGLRASWEFKPTLTAFADLGLDQRDYKTAAFADGISRTSTGERYRFGVSFGSLGAYLRGEVSAGWGRQAAKDERLAAVSGLIVDANLAWKVTGLTTVSFKASSDFLESNIAHTAGSLARAGGAEVRHAFRPWLIATAGLTYTATDYAGVELSSRELAETAGLEYYLNREWTAFARYKHTDYTTTALNADFTDDEFRIGLRWRR